MTFDAQSFESNSRYFSIYRKLLGDRRLTAFGLKRFQTLKNTGITFLNLAFDISIYIYIWEFIGNRGLTAIAFNIFQIRTRNAELFSSVFRLTFDIWEFLDYRGLPDIEVTMISKGFPPPGNA